MKRRMFRNNVIEFLESSIIKNKRVLVVGRHIGAEAARFGASRCVQLFPDGLRPERDGSDVGIECLDVSIVEYRPVEPFDYIVFSESLGYEPNVYEVFSSLRRLMNADAKVFVVEVNPLLVCVLRILQWFGFRTPELKRNMLRLRDLQNLVSVMGFEIIDHGYRFMVPFRWLGLGPVLNAIVPRLPGLRHLCFGQYLVFRMHPAGHERRRLSCSVVVPCYNEEDNVETCIARIPAIGTRTEIIVVDDGSTDRTREIVERMAAARADVRLIAYGRNCGKGYAVDQGWQAATGDVLMMLDCDYTTPPEELPLFHDAMENGAEFINGTRIIYPRERRSIPLLNRCGVAFFAAVISWVTQKRITDTFCGTKVFLRKHRECFGIKEYLWGDWDLFFAAAQYRLKMVEIPVHYKTRKYGEAKMQPIRHGMILLAKAAEGLKRVR